MADYRSKCHSFCNGNMHQLEPYYFRSNSNSTSKDFRSQSLSYSSSSSPHEYNAQPAPQSQVEPKPHKLKKGKSSGCWSVNDPEFQRKRRVASYKVYSVEGKVKGSFRKSFRWIKDRYSQVVYGWW